MTPTNPTRFTPEQLRNMADGFDLPFLRFNSCARALRQAADDAERLAAAEADAEPTTEMSLAGMNAWDVATINARLNGVRLNWPDMMVVVYKAMHAARNPTKEG